MLSIKRVYCFVAVIWALAGLLFYRVFDLAYRRHDYFSKAAETQYQYHQNAIRRGSIYISDYDRGEKTVIASQKAFPYIYAVPRESKDQEQSARRLAQAVKGLTLEEARQIFSKKEDPFEMVKIDPNESDLAAVRTLASTEVNIGYEERRYYPQGNFLSQVIGFVGFDGEQKEKRGQYGLESFYEDHLAGEPDLAVTASISSGGGWFSSLWKAKDKTVEPKMTEGDSLVLTIDRNIQLLAEQALSDLMKKWRPESGVILIQDPNNGSMLAMAGSPSFDPNVYSQSGLKNFVNKSVQDIFEPGSSFKPITMSGALDQKKITPETTYIDRGEVDLAGYHIKNFNEKSFGLQTMTQVLEKSLNTGAMFAEDQLGDDNFLNYVTNFGFGQITGVDLMGEVGGDIANLYTKRKINFATASFGQGIAVTPLQLINAYSALSNGGKLFRPYVVKEIIQAGGQTVETKSELIGTPINEKTSNQIRSMLVNVVENGFDKAKVNGYDVAGKTGTAQISSPKGGYSDEFIHDILGFAPAFSPRFVVLIKLEKPRGEKFASNSLSPALGGMVRFLLNYFKIPPTRPSTVLN